MNIAHLKYAVEVEKTASITKAAENLFMGQPNLSRGIKELEETLGVKIFKRTSKGIVPTPQGEEFLGYAKSILAQIEEMESLYKPEKNNKLKFNISVPRASYIADAFSKFVREADMSKEIEFSFKETNAMRAIRNVVQENYGLAIVRYQTIFESFFTNMLRDKGMKSENIWEFEYQLLISKTTRSRKRMLWISKIFPAISKFATVIRSCRRCRCPTSKRQRWTKTSPNACIFTAAAVSSTFWRRCRTHICGSHRRMWNSLNAMSLC